MAVPGREPEQEEFQVADNAKWTIGDVAVTRIVEHTAVLPLSGLIPDAPDGVIQKHMSWLEPFVADAENIVMSVHALLVESQGQRIVVDTCLGNGRVYPGIDEFSDLSGPFLEDLEAENFARESVDTVLCTHLHFDHVGWNTMLVDGAWVPTFPNARYLFGRREWEHWSKVEGDYTAGFGDTVRPVVEAGLADFVESDHRVTDEVRLEPTPGHTPGHVSVRISSRSEQAVITGDLVHHPIQLAEPQWQMSADTDPVRASETRRDFVARYGDTPVLVIGTHFGGPTSGHIVRDSDSCRFEA